MSRIPEPRYACGHSFAIWHQTSVPADIEGRRKTLCEKCQRLDSVRRHALLGASAVDTPPTGPRNRKGLRII